MRRELRTDVPNSGACRVAERARCARCGGQIVGATYAREVLQTGGQAAPSFFYYCSVECAAGGVTAAALAAAWERGERALVAETIASISDPWRAAALAARVAQELTSAWLTYCGREGIEAEPRPDVEDLARMLEAAKP